MEKPTIIRKFLNHSEYLNQLTLSGANFLAPVRYDLPNRLEEYQPFDYYEVYKNLGISYFFNTIVLMGIAKFSFTNRGRYVLFVRSDDVIKGNTPSEVNLENTLKGSRYHMFNIISSTNETKGLNYIDWINGRKKTYIDPPKLMSILFSCFSVPYTCYLDTSDMRDFVDALSEMELKNNPYTLSTQYSCYTAENGILMAKTFSKSELERIDDFEDKLSYIGRLKAKEDIIFIPKEGVPFKVNGYCACFNPWN